MQMQLCSSPSLLALLVSHVTCLKRNIVVLNYIMQITKYIVIVVFVSHESEYEVVCITKLIKAKVVQSNDYIASRRNGIVI